MQTVMNPKLAPQTRRGRGGGRKGRRGQGGHSRRTANDAHARGSPGMRPPVGSGPKVLCLHGGRQTSEVFRSRLQALEERLVKDLKAQLVFLDGPVSLPLQDGQAESRSWLPFNASVQAELRNTIGCYGGCDCVIGFSAGAAAAAYVARTFEVKAAILAGPPLDDAIIRAAAAGRVFARALLVVGTNDACVSAEESRAFMRDVFSEHEVYEHDKGHSLPTRARDLEAYMAFLRKALSPELPVAIESQALSTELPIAIESQALSTELPVAIESQAQKQAREDEILSLSAIFDEDFSSSEDGACLKVLLAREGNAAKFSLPLALVARLPVGYPLELVPAFSVETMMNALEFPSTASEAIRRCAESAATPGEPSIFAAVVAVNDLLRDTDLTPGNDVDTKVPKITDADDEEEADSCSVLETAQQISDEKIGEYRAQAIAALRSKPKREDSNPSRKKQSSLFEMVIGVVGKPSAGKSTFFNAVTRATGTLAAKVAAYPFTTIDPNVREGLFAAHLDPEPELVLGLTDSADWCQTRYGRDSYGHRMLPVLLKDVAGLVPGAYKGLGKGNRFLNDLLDAHALVHVVDASARTDDTGALKSVEVDGKADADGCSEELNHEIDWVRLELHRWIVGNVAAKWHSVIRRARLSKDAALDRALALFAGYHADADLTLAAIDLAGLEPANLKDWSLPDDLHRLVAAFLVVRFPTVVALNKCDTPSGRANAAEFLKRKTNHDDIGAIPCSASIDALLVTHRAAGRIDWRDGARTFVTRDGDDDAALRQARNVLAEWPADCEFGTLAVVSKAAALANPTFLLPVADLDTLKGAISLDAAPVPDCVILRPRATIDDAFHALRKLGAIDGDFVRADALALSQSHPTRKTVKRRDQINLDARILRVATNRKSRWQQL